MPTTTNLALRYPADGDRPDGPAGIGNLAQDFDGYFAPWTAWTPTVTQLGSVPLTAIDAAYRKVGADVSVRFTVKVSGAGATGSNKIVIGNLPSAIHAVTAGCPVGVASVVDVSTFSTLVGVLRFDAGSTSTLVIVLAAGLAGAATFTAALTTDDLVRGSGSYEGTP